MKKILYIIVPIGLAAAGFLVYKKFSSSGSTDAGPVETTPELKDPAQTPSAPKFDTAKVPAVNSDSNIAKSGTGSWMAPSGGASGVVANFSGTEKKGLYINDIGKSGI